MGSVFYIYFKQLCTDNHTAPTTALREITQVAGISELSPSNWSHWQKGVAPNEDTLTQIGASFNVPIEALRKGPTAFKLSALIKSHTDLSALSAFVGVDENTLKEWLETADTNSSCYDNHAKFAEYFEVDKGWMKSYDDLDGLYQPVFFSTPNKNEKLTGLVQLERKHTTRILQVLTAPQESIVINDGRKVTAMEHGDDPHYQLALDIIEVFDFTETALLPVQLVKEQFLADEALHDPSCVFAQIVRALADKQPCIIVTADSELKILHSESAPGDMEKTIRILGLLLHSPSKPKASYLFGSWLSPE